MTVNRIKSRFQSASFALKGLIRAGLPFTHGIDIGNIGIVKKKGMHPVQAGYNVAHRAMVNPHGRDYTVVYGAWGGDTANPLFCTDAKVLVGIDTESLSAERLKGALADWGRYDKGPGSPSKEAMRDAVKHRYESYFWNIRDVDANLAHLVILDLKMLGVRRSSIRIVQVSRDEIEIDFRWAYPGGPLRDRKIKFFKGDLLNTSSFPPALTALIARGFDVYFQKSAMKCVHNLPDYFPQLVRGARRCILISPAPGKKPHATVDDEAQRFLWEQRYFRMGHINAAYSGLFRNFSFSPFAVEEYDWMIDLWVRMGRSRSGSRRSF